MAKVQSLSPQAIEVITSTRTGFSRIASQRVLYHPAPQLQNVLEIEALEAFIQPQWQYDRLFAEGLGADSWRCGEKGILVT